MLNCFKGAAIATGARLEYKLGLKCSTVRHNSVLIKLWDDAMKALGRKAITEFVDSGGSTDMGNVSQIMPVMGAFISHYPKELTAHSHEWAEAAASETGHQAIIDGAKALAWMAADLICQPEVLARARAEWEDKSIQL